MRSAKKTIWILISLIGIAIIVATVAFIWLKRHDILRAFERASLPTAQHYSPLPLAGTISPVVATPKTQTPVATPLANPTVRSEANLAVPFTVQAPHANWEYPYKEFCEEASILMAMSYLQGEAIPTAEIADQKMLDIKAFEEERFGYYEDTTIQEVATIIREFYDYDQVELIPNPTTTAIKQALSAGKVVIVPAAGQLLGNPYFQQPGPPYHMLVIKGYTADGKFITHDPGTRRGADFLYSESVLMNAIHNWRSDGLVEQGEKIILVVG